MITISFEKICTEDEILALGQQLAKNLSAIKQGFVIYLKGGLGAGKTTFTRGTLRGLGYKGRVKSPTYTLVESYTIQDKQVFHFDLYRLFDSQELEYMGIQDYFTQNALCFIEWPEIGGDLLPPADIHCELSMEDSRRRIVLRAESQQGKLLLESLQHA